MKQVKGKDIRITEVYKRGFSLYIYTVVQWSYLLPACCVSCTIQTIDFKAALIHTMDQMTICYVKGVTRTVVQSHRP